MANHTLDVGLCQELMSTWAFNTAVCLSPYLTLQHWELHPLLVSRTPHSTILPSTSLFFPLLYKFCLCLLFQCWCFPGFCCLLFNLLTLSPAPGVPIQFWGLDSCVCAHAPSLPVFIPSSNFWIEPQTAIPAVRWSLATCLSQCHLKLNISKLTWQPQPSLGSGYFSLVILLLGLWNHPAFLLLSTQALPLSVIHPLWTISTS